MPSLPNNLSTLVALLRWRALHQPGRQAFVFLAADTVETTSITYEELDRQARVIATQLQHSGSVGERALLLYPSSLEYLAAFFGCLYAGVVAVPVYPPGPNQPISRTLAIAADAQATLALTTTALLPKAKSELDELIETLHWFATDDVASVPAERWQEPPICEGSIAFLQYTSGSTADPKGVMVTHGNLLYNEQMIQKAFEQTAESTCVGWLPLYHDMGLVGNILQPLYVGALSVFMSPLDFLKQPFRWLWAISHYKARTSGGPNFAYELCVRHTSPEQRAMLDLSRWELAFNGAEPVRNETLERFASTFAECGFRREALYPCYGLAEATLFVSGGVKLSPPVICRVQAGALENNQVVADSDRAPDAHALVSCGKTWLDQRVVIADPEFCTRCPPNRIGEIWISGPNVARGYWGHSEDADSVFRAYLQDTGEGPFLRTGDLGFLRDGHLFITGRLKDLIIIGGRNYYPQDIEHTVENSHPALRVGCCAAFSIDEGGEEKLVVAAELDRRYQPTQVHTPVKSSSEAEYYRPVEVGTIVRAIQQAVTYGHGVRVHQILLLKAGSIPKTSSGKIRRQACRKGFLTSSLNAWEREQQVTEQSSCDKT